MLAEYSARTLFLDPRETVSQRLYAILSASGFRRSGSHLYRPHCEGCQACVPVRVPVGAFEWTRRFKRVAAANADLRIAIEPPAFTPAYFELYARYIEGRHWDGDMYPPSEDQFRSFLLCNWSRTAFLTMYDGGRLIALAVTDHDDLAPGPFSPGEGAIGACYQRGLPMSLGHLRPGYSGLCYYAEPAPVRAFLDLLREDDSSATRRGAWRLEDEA